MEPGQMVYQKSDRNYVGVVVAVKINMGERPRIELGRGFAVPYLYFEVIWVHPLIETRSLQREDTLELAYEWMN